MSQGRCGCGHALSRHREGRGVCEEAGCGCRAARVQSLPGVYDLGAARHFLRVRTGRPLLERSASTPAVKRDRE